MPTSHSKSESQGSKDQVKVYTMRNCSFCLMAKRLLEESKIPFEEILVPEEDDAQWDALFAKSGLRTMPQIFHGGNLVGGYQDLLKLHKKDGLQSLK